MTAEVCDKFLVSYQIYLDQKWQHIKLFPVWFWLVQVRNI
jgi:hypothetical protein